MISVLIPAYRAERFIGETLESVASQTRTDWEIRVHEDGVTDNTAAIVTAFAKRFPGKVWLTTSESNRGVSSARNQLLASAEGEFLAFLDADDTWLPNHLEAGIESLAEESAEWVISGYQRVNDRGSFLGAAFIPSRHTIDAIPTHLLAHSYIIPTCSMVSRKAIENLQFSEDLVIGEDLEFWVRLCQRACRVAYTDMVTVYYRKHEQNSTRDQLRFDEEFSRSFEQLLGNPLLERKTLEEGIIQMLTNVIRITWRTDPPRAARALSRLQALRFWHPESQLRVALGPLAHAVQQSIRR